MLVKYTLSRRVRRYRSMPTNNRFVIDGKLILWSNEGTVIDQIQSKNFLNVGDSTDDVRYSSSAPFLYIFDKPFFTTSRFSSVHFFAQYYYH